MKTYRIVRFFQRGGKIEVRHGLTLEEAQEHCNDPETSSRTSSDKTTELTYGPWFDGYEEE